MKRILLALFFVLLPFEASATVLQTTTQYVGSVEWAAVASWAGNTPYTAGTLVTNNGQSPAVGNERVFIYITAGTSSSTFTLGLTKGAVTSDFTATAQEVTGQPCVNGDTTNSPQWAASTATVLGEIIYDPTSGSCQIISARTGNTGTPTKPTFSATAGVTTSENAGAVTWTSLGLASSFGAFAAPHARILNADAATWQPNAGNTIYIASDHAETAAATTSLTGGSATGALPNKYLSISKTTVPPTALTAGAKVTTTGAFALSVGGGAYYYGITFSSGTGATLETLSIGTSEKLNYFDTCVFTQGTTGAFAAFAIANSTSAYTKIINSTFTFGATTQYIGVIGFADIINATLAGSTPATLFAFGNTTAGILTFRDSDISAVTGALLSISNANGAGTLQLENCKLGSGVAMTTGTFGVNNAIERLKVHNCDSGSKNYRFYESDFFGTIQQETTIVDSTNPASDGTTPISWNIATTASAAFGQPFTTENLPITLWENTTGSAITVNIPIAGAQSMTNAQIWPECEFLSTSGVPLGVAVTGRPATILTTPTTWATSTDTWGGSPAHKQTMSLAATTPALAGLVKCRIYQAAPSVTEYVSPVITNIGITSGRQYLVPGEGYVNEGASGGGGGGTVGYAY